MIYLLDTNVISETIKLSPNKNVLQWLSSIPSRHFCLSVITIGEIRKSIENVVDESKKIKISKWLDVDIVSKFQDRLITIDERVCEKWGYLCAKHPKIPAVDGLIAASAIIHGLKIVTRNVKDFSPIEALECINPWEMVIV